MRRDLRQRIERLEQHSAVDRVECRYAFDAIRACASYSDYLDFLHFIKFGAPDPVTGRKRAEWRDAQCERLGVGLVKRLGLSLYRDMPFLPLLTDREVERCGELLALPAPMSEPVFREWQMYARWATEGPPADREALHDA